jgi:oligoendopeptidase F
MVESGYPQERWSLDDLFPGIGAPELKQALKDVEQMASDFGGWRQRLTAEIKEADFLAALEQYEAMGRQLERIGGFGYLAFAADTQDQAAQTFLAQIRQLSAQIDNQTLFFTHWWKGLEEEPAGRLMSVAGDRRYWLEFLRLQRDFTLSEPEEKVINLKDVNGAAAMVTLYDTITNRYIYQLTVNGEVKELTRGELMSYVRQSDPGLREKAYQEQLKVYHQDAVILGQIYQARVRDWRSENVDLRGHASPISARNLANNLPDEVVETLLAVCRQNAALFHRFFELKARWLKVGKLRRYDIYAPLAHSDKHYSFGQAADLVLESFSLFDANMGALARRVFEAHHLDSEVRKGKMHGAFCAGITPDLTPWVLTSFEGQPDHVATLAHELGHAVHGLLSSEHSLLTYTPSLPLAETASTFGEMLLIDHLLEVDQDPALQRELLFRQMDDAYATIMRQAYFSVFERTAHDMIHQGASVGALSNAYLENLKEHFGDSIELSEDFSDEWVAIPHFYHAPFYVYAYAFGQLLVFSLYQQYRREGEAFKPRYLEILKAGGSASPADTLKRAGIDICEAAFWQAGFDVVRQAIERLEAIPVDG